VDEKQLAKLIRQNAAKAAKVAKARQGRAYDHTLTVTKPVTDDDDESLERDHFFKEMKRREF
jgi:type I site-specific restriction endonuclease